MITITQRYRPTDGQTTCLGNTALRVASRGSKLVGASARGPAFSWVHCPHPTPSPIFSAPAAVRRLYSCAAPHILISAAFHTIVLALRAAIYCGQTDTRQTRLTTSHYSRTQLKAGNLKSTRRDASKQQYSYMLYQLTPD